MMEMAKVRAFLAMSAVAMVLSVVGGPRVGAEVADGWDYRTIGLSGTYFPLVGQFAGDGATDILWYAPGTGADSLWIGHAGQRGSNAFTKVSVTINKAYIPIVGDFYGDDYSDIIWYAPGSDPDSVWVSADVPGYFTSQSINIGGTFKPTVLHDFTGLNRKDDVLWYAPGSAKDYLWHYDESGSGAKTTVNLSITATFQVVVGDWNADHLEDVFLYAPGTTSDYRWASKPDGTFATSTYAVSTTYRPVTIHQTTGDGILWWGDGSAKEAYWVRNGASFKSVSIPSVSVRAAVTSAGLGSAIVAVPNDLDGAFVGTATGGDWYKLAGATHDVTNQLPVIGDFDDDDYIDVIWYGAGTQKDQLWYSAPAAETSLRDRGEDGSWQETPFRER
jgi:hypothetical protein